GRRSHPAVCLGCAANLVEDTERAEVRAPSQAPPPRLPAWTLNGPANIPNAIGRRYGNVQARALYSIRVRLANHMNDRAPTHTLGGILLFSSLAALFGAL